MSDFDFTSEAMPEFVPSLEAYDKFISDKAAFAKPMGIEIDPSLIHPILKPHQRDTVLWACRGGRRGIFLRFGLGKSLIQLSICDLMTKHIGADARALIVCPLGVKQEFARDAGMIGLRTEFIQSLRDKDIHECQQTFIELGKPIYVTNYESVRSGKLDPTGFDVVSLDEAAILRGGGSVLTFRKMMQFFEGTATYRFVATATPDPNEYIELLVYAEWLGVMEASEAKTRWFKRDSTKADNLTLHEHKKEEFWRWVATWALFAQSPSDLGHSDDGYVLPPLEVNWHSLSTDHSRALSDRNGQKRMFNDASMGLSQASAEKRHSLSDRVERIQEILYNFRRDNIKEREDHAAQRQRGSSEVYAGVHAGESASANGGREGEKASVHEGVLSEEQRAIEKAGEGVREGLLSEEQKERCQSGEEVEEGKSRKIQSGNEGSLRKEFREDESKVSRALSKQQGTSSSRMSPEGAREDGTNLREPSRDSQVASEQVCDLRNDGSNGEEEIWEGASCGSLPQGGNTQGLALSRVQRGIGGVSGQAGIASECGGVSDQVVIFCDLNKEQEAIESLLKKMGISCSSIYGCDKVDDKEKKLSQWRNRETEVLLTKPSMYGAGVNLQQCYKMIFAGINYKFNLLAQGMHRIYRFLQNHKVTIDLIFTEAENGIRQSLEGKWARYDEQCNRMSEIIREFGLADAAKFTERSVDVERIEVAGDKYRLINNDTVRETATMESDSVGLIVTSIPFAFQYEYTPSYLDFGHTDSNEHFWSQMDFLAPELLRVLQPGRVFCCHVKDRIVPGGLSKLGFQTLHPFHAEAIAHYQRHGFAFLGMKTIVTDVVRENNQTYRLGWTEQCKDGSRMGCGVPEYVLLFRKPPTDRSNGYADVPILKNKPDMLTPDGEIVPYDSGAKSYSENEIIPGTGYSRAKWQFDAHGFQRSSGNRLLTSEEIENGMPHAEIFKRWREDSLSHVYDYDHHVEIGEIMEREKDLPSTFMNLPPHSWHPDVWTDVARMRTLNMIQQRKGQQSHLCPLQFDIVNRLIVQLSNPGDVVFDPFGGLMTVPYCAILLERFGLGCELNPGYFADGVKYCKAASEKNRTPTLFDLLENEDDDLIGEIETADGDEPSDDEPVIYEEPEAVEAIASPGSDFN